MPTRTAAFQHELCPAQRTRLHADAVRSLVDPGRRHDHPRRARHDDARRVRAGRRSRALGDLRAERRLERDRSHLEYAGLPTVWRRSATRRRRRPDIRQSSLSLGAADVWRSGCTVDPDPAGNQAKVFPSTTDGFPRTVADGGGGIHQPRDDGAERRRQAVARALDAELPLLPGRGEQRLLGALLHARGRRPGGSTEARRHVTNVAEAANVQLTGPGSTPAGAPTVKLADVPPASFSSRSRRLSRHL